MTCLNDIHIQALADGEGAPEAARHAAGCARCGERVRERIELMGAIRHAIDVPVAVPRGLADTVDGIFRLKAEATGTMAEATGARTGATRLRDTRGEHAHTARLRGFRLQAEGTRRWIYGFGAVAATVIAVLFVAPMLKSPDAAVSASEILAKSATQLTAAITSGVEVLEYELVLEGVTKDMLPDQVDGTYKVWQAIDHDVPGRFRFASYTADGRMLTSIAEDPLRHRRVMAFTAEGQPYRFDVTLPAAAASANMSLPEMQRLHMQATITMMQASGNQLLETVDGTGGRQYRIEVPRVTGPGTNPVWDLTEARVLIDASDYRITEFAVRGSFLKQPYSMSYKLISHVISASVQADAFVVPPQAGEIVIDGDGTNVPTHDVVVLALRELTKLKQGR
jgi:hypothetical protein